jgi:DNA polymerase V
MFSKASYSTAVEVYPFSSSPTSLLIPFAADAISAGFPSPATDYMEGSIDLNKELIKNPNSTFFARVSGLSMRNAGICEHDILVIDRSLPLRNCCIAVCCLDREFTLKRVVLKNKAVWLMPENEDFTPIQVTEDNELIIWGIVTYIIKSA